jgi:hypothetical protein
VVSLLRGMLAANFGGSQAEIKLIEAELRFDAGFGYIQLPSEKGCEAVIRFDQIDSVYAKPNLPDRPE